MSNEQGIWSPSQVMGHRAGRSEAIDSVDDAGTERLAVSASFSGTLDANLDEINDEVAVFGGVDGSETADGTTRQIINVSSTGHVRTDEGATAVAHGANPTAVAAAARATLKTNRAGILFTIGGHPNVITTEFEFTVAQTNAALLTVGAGSKIVVTGITLTLDEATTVGVGVRVGFAAATLPAASGAGAVGIVASHPGLVPGGGFVRGDGSGILGTGADGEDLRITSEVPTSGALRVVTTHYTIES